MKSGDSGGVSRRRFLGALGLGAGASILPWSWSDGILSATGVDPAQDAVSLGFPGPYPGRVVEIRHAGMIQGGVKDAEAVGAAMRRGMVELTGADDATEAWREFFEPGDVVGIKVNPVGNPLANTSHEVIAETIAGLQSGCGT